MAKVLVVDDDPDILELVARTIRKDEHQVITAASGAEALQTVAERGGPDLAVLDVSMPEMDGLELLAALRRMDHLEQLPAIFLSARVQESDIDAGRAMGAVYLTKPFVASALRTTLARLLAQADPDAGW